MNTIDYKRLGEIGAQAAYTSAKSQGMKFAWHMNVHNGLEDTQIGLAAWKGDEPARTAYAQAVIEEYQRITREQAGELLPSAEKLREMWFDAKGDCRDSWAALHKFILDAFARKLEEGTGAWAAVAAEELTAVKAKMEAIAKLPEKWRKPQYIEVHECLHDLEAALGSPADAPAKPDLSAECKMSLRLMTDKLRKCCETHGLGQVGESAENVVIAAVEQLTAKLAVVYDLAPDLEKEGMENFSGYFCHWNEIIHFAAAHGVSGYAQSPMELLQQLVEQRDEASEALAAAESRLALLEWRSAGVKPTREDADQEGFVITYGPKGTQKIFWKAVGDGSESHWLPFCPPPAPSAEDVSRAEFEAAYIEESLKGQPKGAVFDRGVLARGIDNEYVHFAVLGAFRMWNRGRASKEVK